VTEIDRISSVTTWAGQSLLDGSNTNGFNFQIGGRTNAGDNLNVLINSVSATALGVKADSDTTVTVAGIDEGTTGSTVTFAGGTFAVSITGSADPTVASSASLSDSTFAATASSNTLQITAAATGQAQVLNNDAVAAVNEVHDLDTGSDHDDAAKSDIYTLYASDGTTVLAQYDNSFGNASTIGDVLDELVTSAASIGLATIVNNDDGTIGITFASEVDEGLAVLKVGGKSIDAPAAGTSVDIDLADYVADGASVETDFTITIGGTDYTIDASGFDAAGDSSDAGDVATQLIAAGADEVAGVGSISGSGDTLTITFATATSASAATTVSDVATATETTAGSAAVAATEAQAAVSDETVTVTVGGTNFDVSIDTATYYTAAQQASVIASALGDYSEFSDNYSVSVSGDTLTFSGVTADAGTVDFTLNGDAVSVAVSAGDSADDIASAIATAIGDADITNVSASASGAAVSVTKATSDFDVTDRANALAAIDAVDAAISTVNTQRANLGAYSNRLDSTVNNLTNIVNNLSAGRGRIEDADFAAETTTLSKAQILQQASTAMLAQANASKQNVLSLLQG